MKLKNKLLISHLIIASAPIIALAVFFVGRLSGMVSTYTIYNEQQESLQIAPQIEAITTGILKSHESITNTTLMRLFDDSLLRPSLRKKLLDSFSDLSLSDELYEAMSAVSKISTVKAVKLYIDLPGSFSSSLNGKMSNFTLRTANAMGTYWYGIFSGSPETGGLFCPKFYLSAYSTKNFGGDLAYISKHAFLLPGDTAKRYCYLAIYFSSDTITRLLADSAVDADKVSYIVNSRESIVADSRPTLQGLYRFSYYMVTGSFMSSNSFVEKQVLGENVYVGFYTIPDTDWCMVTVMLAAPIVARSRTIVNTFMLIYLVTILVSIRLAVMISGSVTGRLSQVVTQMSKSKNSLPAPLPGSGSKDEVGELVDTYNSMSLQILELTNQQAKNAEDLRVAEFVSLQSQINPHFLYNTMDMINWLSVSGRQAEVTSALVKLSRFYKLTLSHKDSLTTVAQEIEHVSVYMELENMRFNDKIEFAADVPDYMMDIKMPKLTFQPLVENSILHGIMEREDKSGTIAISAWEDGCDIIFGIYDDGIGMDEETLIALNHNLECAIGDYMEGTSGIAVYNTDRRLRVLYGKAYGLRYESIPGKGTVVEVRIAAVPPKKRRQKESSNGI